MESFVALAGLVAIAFASTNLDNMLLLVSLQVGTSLSVRTLFAGYLLGMLGVLAIAVIIGLVGYLFPIEYLGYLGVIPVLMGVRLLFLQRRVKQQEASQPVAAIGSSVAAVAFTQLSNGVDTVLIFSPLLAESLPAFDLGIAVLFVAMILLWFVISRLLGQQAGRLQIVAVLGRWLAPILMICVGIYILSNTATDLMPG